MGSTPEFFTFISGSLPCSTSLKIWSMIDIIKPSVNAKCMSSSIHSPTLSRDLLLYCDSCLSPWHNEFKKLEKVKDKSLLMLQALVDLQKDLGEHPSFQPSLRKWYSQSWDWGWLHGHTQESLFMCLNCRLQWIQYSSKNPSYWTSIWWKP